MKLLQELLEDLDISEFDNLNTMIKSMKEYQSELSELKKIGDKKAIKQLEQDINNLADMISRKKKQEKR